MKVTLLFSAASMSTVKQSRDVRNISIKRPLTMDVLADNEVLTVPMAKGKRPLTTALAAMPPRISAGNRKRPRTGGRFLVMTRVRRTWLTRR